MPLAIPAERLCKTALRHVPCTPLSGARLRRSRPRYVIRVFSAVCAITRYQCPQSFPRTVISPTEGRSCDQSNRKFKQWWNVHINTWDTSFNEVVFTSRTNGFELISEGEAKAQESPMYGSHRLFVTKTYCRQGNLRRNQVSSLCVHPVQDCL